MSDYSFFCVHLYIDIKVKLDSKDSFFYWLFLS